MFYLTLYITKLIKLIIDTFKLGYGYTWPGHIALNIYPNILKNKKIIPKKGLVLVAGTNGKTTTTKLITYILNKRGLNVVSNKSGANLLNGIVSALLLDTDILGKVKSEIGVFEVDEFALPLLLEQVSPRVLVLLNLSRDQLDRYGEVDVIFDLWKNAISKLGSNISILIDPTQARFNELRGAFPGTVFEFSEEQEVLEKTKLSGDFNQKNIGAALTAVELLGFDKSACMSALEGFEAAYGRGESIEYGGKAFALYLAKNPVSFSNNLNLLIAEKLNTKNVLVVLNDNIPDGRDVSWIYDVDPEMLKKAFEGKTVFVSGVRCLDMAVRLKYAGVKVEKENIEIDLKKMVSRICDLESVRELVVLPNYSSMLELRQILKGRKIL